MTVFFCYSQNSKLRTASLAVKYSIKKQHLLHIDAKFIKYRRKLTPPKTPKELIQNGCTALLNSVYTASPLLTVT
jgi:hypothetical protein